MADGYSLEVNADLDQSKYRRDVEAMKAFTKAQGLEMEKSLNITARVDDNASKTIQKINAEKIASKEFLVDANVERALAEVGGLEASIQGNPVDIPVTADTSIALGELETLQGVAQANPIDIPVTTSGGGRAAIQGLSTDLVTASRGAEQVTSRLGTMALVAGGVGAAFAGIGLAVGGFGVAVAAQLDSAIFGFKRLVGNAGIADAALRDLKETATETPFAIGDVLNVGFRLKAAGRDVKGLSDDVRTLSDALVVSGGSAAQLEGVLFAIQQTRGTGRVEQRDLRQIANNIPSFAAGQFESYVAEAKKAGKSGADALIEAIFIGLKKIPGAAGASAAATEETFVGKFSNFKDKIQLQFLDAFTPNKDKIFKALDQVTAAVGPALAKLAPVAVDALASLGPILASTISALTPIVGLMTQVFVILANKVVPYIDRFAKKIQEGEVSAEGVAKVFGGLVAGGILLKLTAGVLGVVTPLINFATAAGPIFASAFSGISGLISGVGASFSALLATGSSVTGALGTMASAAAAAAAPFAVIGSVIAALVLGITSSKERLHDFFSALKIAGGGVLFLLGSFKDLAVGVIGFLKPVGEALAPVLNALLIGFGGIAIAVGGVIRVFGGLVKAVAPAIGFIAKFALIFTPLGIALGAIDAAFERFGPQLKAIGQFFSVIAKAISSATDAVGKFFGGLVGGAEKALSKIPLVGRFFDDSSKKVNDNADKTSKKLKEVAENFDLAKTASKGWGTLTVEEATAVQSRIGELAAGLEDSIKIDKKGLIDSKSVEKALAAVDKQIGDFNARAADIKLISDSGYDILITQAQEVGGAAGDALITDFAKKIKKGDTKGLDEFKKNLFALEIAKYEVGKLVRKEIDRREKAALDLEDDIKRKDAAKRLKKDNEAARKRIIQANKRFEDDTKIGINPLLPKDTISDTSSFKPKKKTVDDEDILKNNITPLGLVQTGQDLASGLFKGFTDFFSNNDLFKSVKDFITQKAPQLASSVASFLLGIGPKIFGFIKQGVTDAVSVGGDILGAISGAIGNAVSAIVGKLGELKDSVARKAGEVLGAAKQIGTNIWEGIISGLTSAGGAIVDIASRIWNAVRNFINTRLIDPLRNFQVDLKVKGIGISFQPFAAFPGLENGTNFAEGGMYRVGERPGGEDMYVPRGSKVVPAHKTVDLEARSSGDTYHTEVHGVSFDQAVAEWDAKTRAKRRQAFV